ncbi:hypothetical protein TRFO_38535 [Tritrichomonas foetus]|uniref:Importin N-terminal domain-containing protein n=1 Tax=Tritrichomonas foetus TaxID=1144522 RepID=A0A1J4J818_9EUKA|nr:hypothetical protein TRFO_38535 [Tritrichomonas foetus]|eukprot:OHS95346.1 hypothetical protein TRFO_38535 [Tritrichomonas foetus]
MAELEQLYSALSQGMDPTQISGRIMEIYNNPQSIFEILQIINNNENAIIRHHASVGLRKSLELNVAKIAQDPAFEQVKEMIISALLKTPEMIIRDSIIHAMAYILDMKVPWPQLDSLIQNLFQDQIPIQVETAMKVLFIMVPNFNPQQFAVYAPTMGQQIVAAIQTNIPGLVKSGFELFSQTIPFFDQPLISPYSDILTQIFTMFHQAAVEMDDLMFFLLSIIERVIESNNGGINFEQLLQITLQFAIDPHISSEACFYIFSPIQAIIMKDQPQVIKQHVNDILKTTIFCIAKSFADECFSDSCSGYLISNSIDTLCEYMNSDKLYKIAMELLSENSPNEIFASAIVFDRFIETAPAQAVSNSAFLIKTLIKYMTPELHHSIREASLNATSKLIELVENGLIDFFDSIIQSCIAAIDSGHDNLIISGLRTMIVTLDSIDFSSKYLEILMPKLIPLTRANMEVATYAIGPISSLIIKCERDVVPYIPEILPFIVQASQINEKTNPILKGEAIETLAKLIAVAPEETASIIQPSLQMFSECTKTEDSSIIASLLAAFSILVSAKFPGVETVIPLFLQFAIAQLDCQQQSNVIFSEGFDPEENNDQNMDIATSIQNAILVVENVARYAPEVLAPAVPNVIDQIVNYVSFPSELLRQNALSTLAALISTYKLDPNGIFSTIGEIFDEFEPAVVAAMFSFCQVLIDNNLPLQQPVVVEIFRKCIEAIEHKLSCINCEMDGDDEFDDDDGNANIKLDLVNSVFKCLSAIAMNPNFSQYMDLAKFVQACKIAVKKGNVVEVVYSTDVIGRLFETRRANFTQLILKFALNVVMESLNFCDGTHHPYPLIAIRRILLTDPSVLTQAMNAIMEKINQIIHLENSGQPFYHQTRAAAVNVILALARIQGQQFPLATYLPIIFAVLPTQYEANFIYESIVFIFNQANDIFAPVAAELIRSFAQTLAVKDSDLDKYSISQETLVNMTRILAMVLHTIPNDQEILASAITDQNSLSRLQSRLNSVHQ